MESAHIEQCGSEMVETSANADHTAFIATELGKVARS